MIRLAYALFAATMCFVALSLASFALTRTIELPVTWSPRGIALILPVVLGAIGLLIVRRHRGHVVGWTFLIVAALNSANWLAREYLILSYFALPQPLPAAAVIGWVPSWSAFLAFLGLIVGPLHFPNGQLPSPRWRWLLAVGVVASLVQIIGTIADPDVIAVGMFGVSPPYDPRGLGVLSTYARPLYVGGGLLVFVAALLSSLSVFLRFPRATSRERQQIKWLALPVAVVGVTGIIAVVAQALADLDLSTPAMRPLQVLFLGSLYFVPVAIAIAILRHRLFDIDLIISRALVYGTLSALLVATYATAVVLLQAILRPFTAGSDLAIAASTLLVVALFQPLRQRIQDEVDRRFYRSRYDAARALDAFTARLRSDVDLDSVRSDLVRVIDETVQPAHASVWLREVRR